MKFRLAVLLGGFAAVLMPVAHAQGSGIKVPTSVEAGSAFSMQTTGTGKGVLYIVSPAQALRRDVQLGETVTFPAGTLYNSGHYLVILAAEQARNVKLPCKTVPSSSQFAEWNHGGSLCFRCVSEPGDQALADIVCPFQSLQSCADSYSNDARRSRMDRDEFRRQGRRSEVCGDYRGRFQRAHHSAGSRRSMLA
jgi:hypothetical protein